MEEIKQRILEPFDKQRHRREDFSCEVESLQHYLKTQAAKDARKNIAAVFVLAEGTRILGYYTLSSYTIDLGELPADVAAKLPKYPKLPATLIGRLARDQNYRRQGIGELMLVDALRRCLENTATVGSFAVVVEAENEKARQFYLEYGFIRFPANPNKLFLPMSTIKESFSGDTFH